MTGHCMYIVYTCIRTASYAWMLTQTEREKSMTTRKAQWVSEVYTAAGFNFGDQKQQK